MRFFFSGSQETAAGGGRGRGENGDIGRGAPGGMFMWGRVSGGENREGWIARGGNGKGRTTSGGSG